MELPLYQVDAFAARPFEGNPAAVCPLTHWLPDELMQKIAMENNLSETAFFVPTAGGFHIRWFTPTHEIDLCGHATLATAHVLFNHLNQTTQTLTFESRSGVLRVKRTQDGLEMDFPAQPPMMCQLPELLRNAFSSPPIACLAAEDYILVFENEDGVIESNPDFALLRQLDLRGVAITAQSESYDFVCRFFAPKYGIDEDPVTGSAFTQLIPYWAGRLGKRRMTAKQISKRGGEVTCELLHERVGIAGRAVTIMIGSLLLNDCE